MEKFSHSTRNKLTLIAICLGTLMFSLEISSVPVILPTLEKLLRGSFKDLQWVVNSYTIACTTILMAAGTLADRFGRKRIFIISVILFGVASLACGLSQSMFALIVSRTFQGIGGGALLISQTAILSHQFQEGKERNKAFSIWGVMIGIGLGFGSIIGGSILALASWQWVFLIHVVLTIVTIFLALASVEESKDPLAKKLDIGGIITLSLSVFFLAYYITQGADLGFSNIVSLGILVASIICFLLFLWVEKSIAHPMFDFSVFRIPSFSGAILGCMGMNFTFWPFIIYFPIFIQGVLHRTPTTTGFLLLIYTLPTILVTPLAVRLATLYKPRVIVPLGMFVIGAGFLLMKLSIGSTVNEVILFLGALIAGIGLGLTNTPTTDATTGSVPSSRAGMASGMDMSARFITLAINIAVMGTLLVSGIFNYLKNKSMMPAISLHSTAEKVAAGNFSLPGEKSIASLSEGLLTEALKQGFGWLMLYGCIGVWILAFLSYIIFSSKKYDSKDKTLQALTQEGNELIKA